ncbi:MAG TPA: EXLDI protein [Nocardia sp.]|uniref:EXLDI protein n=1 Tax=Nocardia TaxID=1817 RepID=UPI002454460B|nr:MULTISPECIES: EXLDI protein [Nocardia]HLS79289.1 EXLDI protein [Nocardia sp.]
MPNKTIYVADDDLPLFKRAQELVGGNLSGAVVAALRRFIDLEEGRLEGFEEVILGVGHHGVRQVRFSGALLGEWRDIGEEKFELVRVYRSRKGKFVKHSQVSRWVDYPTEKSSLKDWRTWRRALGVGDPDWGEFDLAIVDSVAELKDELPQRFYERIADLALNPKIEDLDI